MENKDLSTEEQELIPLYAKIDINVKNRMDSYIIESKFARKDIKNQKQFLEEAIDEYIINNPIPLRKE